MGGTAAFKAPWAPRGLPWGGGGSRWPLCGPFHCCSILQSEGTSGFHVKSPCNQNIIGEVTGACLGRIFITQKACWQFDPQPIYKKVSLLILLESASKHASGHDKARTV